MYRRLLPLVVFVLALLWILVLSPPAGHAQTLTTSQTVTWNCVGSPCPWGDSSFSGIALVWPAALGPVNYRLGYTTSESIYLPAEVALGMVVELEAGSASIYAGAPDASSHRLLVALNAGQSYVVEGVVAGEVISVQADNPFTMAWTIAEPEPPTATPTATEASPTATPQPCSDPENCEIVSSIRARWRCNVPGCTEPDWTGWVINWPSWSAYEDNGRTGSNSRIVYSADGELLYPYMGSWANGCEVTTVSGTTLIVEWQRGTDVWRETYLPAGQSYTINLISPEDGVLIESEDGDTIDHAFSISLSNCEPQIITKVPTPTPTVTEPSPTVTPEPCTDPENCEIVTSIPAFWRCNVPECTGSDWVGTVINWPSWSAYAEYGGTGSNSRTVYSANDEILYPHMGSWASGCQVTVVSGTATIVEWESGVSVWRTTELTVGQSHTIDLIAPENRALIEGTQFFAVSLSNCEPQVVSTP